MKKQYDVPLVEVLLVFENDVISTSDHTGKDIYNFEWEE